MSMMSLFDIWRTSICTPGDDYIEIVIHLEKIPELVVIRNIGCSIQLALKGDKRIKRDISLSDRPPHYFVHSEHPITRYWRHDVDGVIAVFPRCVGLRYVAGGAGSFGAALPSETTDVLSQQAEAIDAITASIGLQLDESESERIAESLQKGEIDGSALVGDSIPAPKVVKPKRGKRDRK